MKSKPKIFDIMEKIAPLIPVPLYWLDINGTFLGGNELCLYVTGAKSLGDFIGKTYDEIHPPSIAEELVANIQYVIKSRKTTETEEVIKDFATGETRYFLSIRSPLFENEEIVGIIATSIEITAQKEKEHLELENQAKQARIEEQAEFRKIVDQVAHDIRSPIATMQMVLPHCDTLTENLRDTLNKSAIRIADIANNLLAQFQGKEEDRETISVKRLPSLISAGLLEILTEKKYEYAKRSVHFTSNITQAGYFAFINVDMRSFKRSISNLINNAVDAFNDKAGNVLINLDADGTNVKVIIEDNGKGIPAEIIQKIMSNIEVTSGKKEGFGIGYTQVRDMLSNNEGKLSIESKISEGSKITLIFPRVTAPNWVAERIDLYLDDLVIILDDDESIHGAWEARFEKAAPFIQRKHFKQGIEVIEFINTVDPEVKGNIFLLTDYELLRQNLNGLDVIEQTTINRSVLVTSHHNNPKVRDAALSAKTKILPKPLASEVPIVLSERLPEIATTPKLRKIDLVIVDDDADFVNSFVRFITDGNNKTIDKFFTAREFQESVSQYAKDVLFLIDNSFKGEDITGIELSKSLHEMGYTNLHLFSGRDLRGDASIPNYLDVILKTDFTSVKHIIG